MPADFIHRTLRLLAVTVVLCGIFNPSQAAWSAVGNPGDRTASSEPLHQVPASMLALRIGPNQAEQDGSATTNPQEDIVSTAAETSEPLATSTVGMMSQLKELKLPGTLLEVKPIEDRDTPMVVRIVRTFPHGSDHRYDIEYYGLEPGTYNLLDYMQREDGSPITEMAPVTVVVNPILPDGQVEPHRPESGPLPNYLRYRLLLVAFGVVWVVGLGFILLWRRQGKSAADPASTRPKTLADQLRPLVDRAVSGQATPQELASLERSLITFWRKRLSLESLPAGEAIHELRSHPEAGGLISQLESWLHQPGRSPSVPVETLLQPYRNIAKQDLEALDPKATGGSE